MANDIKLQITTALDNAGIKATADQIKQLQDTLDRPQGKDGFMAGVEKSVTGLPGKMGKVVEKMGMLGKAAGVVGAAIAAWSEGRQIGEKIREWAGETFEWAQSFNQVQEKIAEIDRQLEDQKKQEIETVKLVSNIKLEALNKEQAKLAETEAKIDRNTRSYLTQAESLQKIQDARGSAKQMQLQRELFETRTTAKQEGFSDEAIAQVEKYYEILSNTFAVQEQLAKADVEAAKDKQTLSAAEEKYINMVDKANDAYQRAVKDQEKLDQIRKTTSGEKRKEYEKIAERSWKHYDKLASKAEDYAQEMQKIGYGLTEKEISRSNLAAGGAASLAGMLGQLDELRAANGSLVNFDEDELQSMADDINSFYQTSGEQQRQIVENTAGVKELLQQLLEMKR